jgi:hypothetical protein
MKSTSSSTVLLLTLRICGVVVVAGHSGLQVPLHEQDFVQDSLEGLERKWSFEVEFFRSFSSVWLGKSTGPCF